MGIIIMSKFVTSAVLTLAVAGAVVPATTIVASANSHKELKTVKVGINSPSKTDQAVWKIVEKNGEKHGIKIKLVTFTDFNQPNAALKQGNIDANSFQHYAFLADWNKAHKSNLQPVGETVLGPGRLYSDKYKSVKDIPDGGTVAVANDPTNEARALFLLQAAGLIKIKAGVTSPTVKDIVSSAKHLHVKELAADQTLASLKSVDAAVISATFVEAAGRNPNSAIYVWNANNKQSHQWVNIIAARHDDAKKWYIKALVKSYQTKEVGQYINDHNNGTEIAAWQGAPKAKIVTADTASSATTASSK
jgi:D-methionine transport system substrate-binding protein